MQKDRFTFVPKISTRPNKIVLYNQVVRNVSYEQQLADETKNLKLVVDEKGNLDVKPKLEKRFHDFKISQSGQNNLRDKITWLYHLSRSRFQKSLSGKEIYNFKINFITLTLPSAQVHPTSQVTSECFNQFLTEIRQQLGMENYVWRLEFQRNGNCHYHIVTDTYVDYFLCRKIWNRCINKLGYVDTFQKKMQQLSLLQYHSEYGKGLPENFDTSKKRYLKGKLNNWAVPSSVDVKACTSGKTISLYISKYFSKKDKSGTDRNILDTPENSFSLRLWFCSRSLSRLHAVVDYVEAIDFNPHTLISGYDNVRVIIYDYATVFYFELSKMTSYVKQLMFPYLRNYANSLNYNSA